MFIVMNMWMTKSNTVNRHLIELLVGVRSAVLSDCSLLQVLSVDPKSDQSWKSLQQHIRTDEVHANDRLNPTIETPGMWITHVLIRWTMLLYCL